LSADPTFEELRAELDQLEPPEGDARTLRWLGDPLAVARNSVGDYEIFLLGPTLHARSALVRRHLQHGDWRPQSGGEAFAATRIVLPSAPHFASVVALIAVELLRAGVASTSDTQTALFDVEPIIEMAIRRGALPENVIVGLIGELIVLRQALLLVSREPERRAGLVANWHGWQHGARDFRFGSRSLEVKATQAAQSIHEFSGIHQLEEAILPTGDREELHLLSIGLVPSSTVGESLPHLVSQIEDMLDDGGEERDALQLAFLSQVEGYGALNGTGYRHSTMAQWGAYSTRYSHTFPPRLYRVADPAMRLLTREMLADTFAEPASVSFALHLPEQVSAYNPAANWQDALASIISP
jgi:hypothetical protein